MSKDVGSTVALEIQPKPPNKYLKSFKRSCHIFCESTTIHGVRYIGEKGRSPLERLLWIVVILCVTTLCAFLIWQLYSKWMSTPVIVSFQTESTHLWEIPFPAVTICPNRFVVDNVDFLDTNKCLLEIGLWLFTTTCWNEDNDDLIFPPLDPNCNFTENLKEALSLIKDANIVGSCSFLESPHATDIVLTDMGICISFNLLEPKDIFKNGVIYDMLMIESGNVNRSTSWTLSSGYNDDFDATYPNRVITSGMSNNLLSVVSTSDPETVDVCPGSEIEGFTVLLHTPIEFPSSFLDHVPIPFQKRSFVYIYPNIMSADEDIRYLPIEQRKCRFDDEDNLRFFRHYTQSNCVHECLINLTYSKCNCVQFHMPRTSSMKICKTKEEVYCAENAEHEFEEPVDFKTGPHRCNCLPNCYSIRYVGDTLHSTIEDENGLPGDPWGASIVSFFVEDIFWPSKRSMFYTTMEFVADCGGLMGLCMGISAISIIELVYHFSIRLVRPRGNKVSPITEKPNQAETVERIGMHQLPVK